MTLQELHTILETSFKALADVASGVPDGIGSDTAFAVGDALGTLSKAKALVGRDIEAATK